MTGGQITPSSYSSHSEHLQVLLSQPSPTLPICASIHVTTHSSIYSSLHLPTHSSPHSSIYPSTHLPRYLFIHMSPSIPSIYLPIHPSMIPTHSSITSIHYCIHPSTHLPNFSITINSLVPSIDPSTNILHPFIKPSTYLTTHVFIHSFIHPSIFPFIHSLNNLDSIKVYMGPGPVVAWTITKRMRQIQMLPTRRFEILTKIANSQSAKICN